MVYPQGQMGPEADEDIEDDAEIDVGTETEVAMAESAAAATRSAAEQPLSPSQAARYRRYVKEAKEASKKGNLEEALRFFYFAKDIFPNDKILSRIQRLQEALEQLSVEGDDEFVDVCNSGLMMYRELHDRLFEHQKEGVAFLYSLYKDGREGGILADDMGLGKTIQIIAFLSAMFDANLVKCVLLIMPTSLINTWTKEFAKWTPGMRVSTFHGSSKSERTKNLNRIQKKNGVAVTTYQMLLNNWQQLSQLDGRQFVWDYLILDEAHKIKSSSAKSSVAARAIPVKNRILLTGTPIQNNLYELWSLFDFACQGSLLGTSKTFKMEYENPIIRAREKDATSEEKALGLKMSENLMMLIKPYFLRRTKDDVQKKSANNPQSNLPEKNPGSNIAYEIPSLSRKNELIIWVHLVPLQEEIYRKFLSLNHIKQLLTETRSPLAELTVLKKLCDHPRLLSTRVCSLLGLKEGSFCGEDETQEAQSEIQIDQIPHASLMQESGKVIFLMALLKRLQDEGHQTLVFSQSRKLLDIIEHLLKTENFETLRIDGTVTHILERQRRIELFQRSRGVSVFLLTSQVGGVGLTLTAATRVVIFDPSWNPATDAQAVDRVYRIGQKENVVVYRLITCGTVEEKIYRRQVFKNSLIRQTTGDQKNPVRYFSKQELRELFTIENFRSSATQLQLHSLQAGRRKTDKKLEEHIAYLHTLGIAGISDHDLMFTHDVSIHEESEAGKSKYIQERVQKAQLLVELESQNNKLLLDSGGSRVYETWMKAPLSYKPKKKCSEFNAMHHRSSPIAVDLTHEDSLNCGIASLSIVKESEASSLSVINVDDSVKQSDVDILEQKTDDEFITSFSNEECHEVEISNTNNPDYSYQALPDTTQESVKLLSAHETAKVDLEPNPDQLTNSEILVESSILPFNLEKPMELSTSFINPGSKLSAGPSALENSKPNEDKLGKEPLDSSEHDVGDFNLFLEDSLESGQDCSKQCLEPTKMETGMWDLATNPSEKSNLGHLQSLSDQGSDIEEEIVPVKMRYKMRIVSDDEDNSMAEEMLPPFLNPLLTHFSSTPKGNKSQSDMILPEICSSENNSAISRRSIASRRSLINVILDHVEDMEEDASEQKSMDQCLEETEAAEYQDSGHSEEEPAKETSLSQSEPHSLSEPGSVLLQSASGEDSQETIAYNPGSAPVTDEYEALVRCGKELKETGKIQEALKCFLKALDIKSTDPQVMLLTLDLYKQLNQT